MNIFKNIIYVYLLLGYSLVAAQGQTPRTLTLKQCIDIALEKNVNAQRAEINTEQARLNKKTAQLDVLPSLNGNVSHNYNVGRNINPVTNIYENQTTNSGNQSLGASMLLFRGLYALKTIRERNYAYQATKFDEQSAKENLTMDVILAYLEVVNSYDLLEQRKQQLEVTQKNVERNETLNKEGNIKPDEYYDLIGQMQNEKRSVNNTEQTLKNNKITLFRLLNMTYDDNVQFEAIGLPSDTSNELIAKQYLYEKASATLGTIKSAEMWKKSSEYSLKATRSLYFPSLSINGGLNTSYNNISNDPTTTQMRNNLGQYVGVTLSIPIMGTLYTRLNVSRAKLDLKDSEIELDNRKNSLDWAIEQLLTDLETKKSNYIMLKEEVAAYTETFRIAQIRFDLGAINSVEFLQQKNKMDAANINLIVAQYQWVLIQRVVDFYEGKR